MRWGQFLIDVGEDGSRVVVSRAGEEWLTLKLRGLKALGGFIEDLDEVDHAFEQGPLRLAVRHSVGEHWTLRYALSAHGDAEPASWRLNYQAGPATCTWVWAAGAEGRLLVAPRDAKGPVLSFRLISGWLEEDDGRLWVIPRELELPDGGRFATTLQVSQVADLAEVGAGLPSWLPAMTVPDGEPVELATPDWAVVPPGNWEHVFDQGVYSVLPRLGVHRVTVHSPRGLTHLDVATAPPLTELLVRRADELSRQQLEQTAGELGSASAFVITEALARGLMSAPREAEELLEGQRPVAGDLLGIAVLAARSSRLGRTRGVRTALNLLGRSPVVRGYGRVVMRTWLAALALGLDAQEEAGRLLARGCSDPWGAFEQRLFTLRSAEGAAPAVAGLVNVLGGGLPGHPGEADDVEVAHAVGLLSLCPEEWPGAHTSAEAVGKSRLQLLARLVDEPDDEVLAWLVLGEGLL